MLDTTTFTQSQLFLDALAAQSNPVQTEGFETLPADFLIHSGDTVNGISYEEFPTGTADRPCVCPTGSTAGRVDDFWNRFGTRSLALERDGQPGAKREPDGDFFIPGESSTVTFPFPVIAVGIFFASNRDPLGQPRQFIRSAAGEARTGVDYDAAEAAYGTHTLFFAGLISDIPFRSATIGSVGSYGDPGFNVDNLMFSPDRQPDIIASNLAYNTSQGGVDFSYQVMGANLAKTPL